MKGGNKVLKVNTIYAFLILIFCLYGIYDFGIRIIKKTKYIQFASSDSNGLHNYVTKRYRRVYAGYGAKWKRLLSSIANFGLFYKEKICASVNIHHIHYYDLKNAKKHNDLRSNEIENAKIILLTDDKGGMKYRLSDGNVCVVKNDNKNHTFIEYLPQEWRN